LLDAELDTEVSDLFVIRFDGLKSIENALGDSGLAELQHPT
jgi:hypothetical protein